MSIQKPPASLAADVRDLSRLKQDVKSSSPESIRAAAAKFEALFMNMVLKSMRASIPSDGPFDSEQSRTFTAMLDQQLSQSMAGRGVGLADILARQLGAATGVDMSSALPPLKKSMPSTPAWTMSSVAPAIPRNLDGGRQADKVARFVDRVSDAAQSAAKIADIPADFMIAQAALESGWGAREIKNSDGSSTHNLFGIKAGPEWKGKVADVVTTEYRDGVAQKMVQKFRVYGSDEESFRDYAHLLSTNSRYQHVRGVTSSQQFAVGLQKAGYASDPGYSKKLEKLIQQVQTKVA